MIIEMIKNILRINNPIKKKNLYAVYEEDLEELLISAGLQEKISLGKETCVVCKDKINYESLQAIVKINGIYKIICIKEKCLRSIEK